MRRLRWLVVMALATAACSGSDDSASTTTVEPAVSPVTTAVSTAPATTSPATTAPAEPATVSLSLVSQGLGVSARVTGEISADADPFGDFATCAASAELVGPYVVGVGASSGAIRWASVVTAARVGAGGVYDADVRVELSDGDTIDAVGTLSLDDGLTAGTFLAFTADGQQVDGDFECSGVGRPTPVADRSGAGELVEIAALLQRGDAERVIWAVSDDADVAVCPFGDDDALVVRLAGGDAHGSIGGFELTGGDGAARLELDVAGAEYSFGDAEMTLATDRVAGTFSAASGEIAVDGAFSCSTG